MSEEDIKKVLKIAFKYRHAYVGHRIQCSMHQTDIDEEKEWNKDIDLLYSIVEKYLFDMRELK